MWYMPYMRVRHAVLVYMYIGIGISFVAVALRYWPGAVHLDGHEAEIHATAAMIFAGSAALVGGLATVLGLNLAAENDGHLELAWTKPISREGYALGVFAVDIAAMAICILFTVACSVLIVDVYAGRQAVTLGAGDALLETLAYCGFPLCVYAWVTALSASLKRNRGGIAGAFWPAMIALGVLKVIPVPAIHAPASVLNLINPIVLFSTNSNMQQSSIWAFAWGWFIAALLLAAAVVQWRRLQL